MCYNSFDWIKYFSFQILNFKTARPKIQVRMVCVMSEVRSIKLKGSNNIFKPFSIVNLS